jgi:hypothetical protein
METRLYPCITWIRFLGNEVNACFIPVPCSPSAANCEVRQQYRLLLKPHDLEADIKSLKDIFGKSWQKVAATISESTQKIYEEGS